MIECPNCGKDVDNLELHNSQFHEALEVYGTEEDQWTCDVCGKELPYGSQVGDHLLKEHNITAESKAIERENYICHDCGNEYDTFEAYDKHVKEDHGTKAGEGRSKKEIQKEIDHLQEFINVASFENPLNMGADNDKLSALQVEWANATEIEHQQDKPEMTQKDWDKELTGLKDDYATEDEEEVSPVDQDYKPPYDKDIGTEDEEDDLVIDTDEDLFALHKGIMDKPVTEADTDDYEVDVDEYIKTGEPVQKIPEDKRAEEQSDEEYAEHEDFQDYMDQEDERAAYNRGEEAEDPRCENCGDLEDLNDDGLCDYCHQEAGIDRKESERDAYEVDETETSDDGTDVNTPAIPDVDNTDTDDTTINDRNQYPAEFNTETWDKKVTFNTKVQAFEGIGLTQGDALKLSELNWRELSIEVRGALNEFADDEKEEKRLDIQDAFNEEGAGDGADQPDTTIEDLDEIDYNIIGDNPVAVEKYECEHCNSGFRSNEALMIHYNDIHVPAREFMLDVPNTCTYCGQEIPANVSMGEHLAYEHGISLDVKLENGQVEDGFEGGQGSGPHASLPEQAGRDPELKYDPFAPDPDPVGDPSTSKMTETRKIKGNENLKKKNISIEIRAEERSEYWTNNFYRPSEMGYEDHFRCKICGADVFRDDIGQHYDEHEAKGDIPTFGESWKPHVYKATEAVSYEEEEIDLNTPEGKDVINDLNKPYDLVPRIKEPWETEREGDPSIGEADFKEDEHPREDSGKFTSGGGGTTKQKEKPKLSKNFNKAKDKILKQMGEPKDDYDRKKQLMIKNLDGYPQHSSQLRSVGVRYKVPIMKSHLQDVYPESKWSVRTEYYSGGSSIKAGWTGGGPYPYGANSIKELYSDSGATDLMTDYFDVDNYVDLYDHRKDKPEFDHGQHIYKDRAERFSDWTRIHLDQKSEYEASNTWSKRIAEDFTKNDVTGYQGVSDDVLKGLKELYGKFQDQEKKEGGGATPKEVPKSTTPASYMKPTSQQRVDEPSEFPIDPETGEDLPVSAYNPNAAKYRKPDPEDTKKDVTKAYGLMKGQKGQTDEQPWQKGGEVRFTIYDSGEEHDWMKQHGTLISDDGNKMVFEVGDAEQFEKELQSDPYLSQIYSKESYAKEESIYGSVIDDHFDYQYVMDQDGMYKCKHCGAWLDVHNIAGFTPQEVAKHHLQSEHGITEARATETTIDKCIHCGRTADNHANPNTDYRGLHGDAPATDHYYEALDDGVESHATEVEHEKCPHCNFETSWKGGDEWQKEDAKTEMNNHIVTHGTTEAMYGYGSATGRMSPRDAWEQGASSEGGMNPVFQEFRTLHWSEVPIDIQELWKSELEYLTSGEAKANEADVGALWNEWNHGPLLDRDTTDPVEYMNTVNWWLFAEAHGLSKEEADAKMKLETGEAKANKPSGEAFVTEDDPDFENDPDYQGFVGGKKKESSQYTQQGITDAMADPDYDKLDEVKANEVECPTCGYGFDSYEEMDAHQRQEHVPDNQ